VSLVPSPAPPARPVVPRISAISALSASLRFGFWLWTTAALRKPRQRRLLRASPNARAEGRKPAQRGPDAWSPDAHPLL